MRKLFDFLSLRLNPFEQFRLTAIISAILLHFSGLLMAQPMTQPGNALKFVFDGENITYVSAPNASGLISGSAFTIEGWVYPMGTKWGDDGGLYYLYDHFFGFRNNTNCDFYILQLKENEFEARFKNSSGTEYTIYAVVNGITNQWQHLALTYDGTNLTLYRNGISIGSMAASGSLSNTTQELFIGGIYDSYSDDLAYPLRGKVDEFRMWKSARTQAELKDNMTNVVSSSSTNLVLYYKFDQSTGTTLTDEKGSHNGVLTAYPYPDAITSTWVESYGMVVPGYAAPSVGITGFTAKWTAPTVGIVSSYKLDVSTSSTFATFVTGYNNLDCGTNLSLAVNGLTSNTTYYYRVRAVKSTDPGTGANSDVTTVLTLSPPAIPTITSFTPTSAGTGTTVTITGTNFTGATAVSFGGTAATSFSVVSSTSITAVVAGGASGTISVVTPGGTATSADPFTFILTWTGTTSSAWNTTGNWNSNIIPSAADNVISPMLQTTQL